MENTGLDDVWMQHQCRHGNFGVSERPSFQLPGRGLAKCCEVEGSHRNRPGRRWSSNLGANHFRGPTAKLAERLNTELMTTTHAMKGLGQALPTLSLMPSKAIQCLSTLPFIPAEGPTKTNEGASIAAMLTQGRLAPQRQTPTCGKSVWVEWLRTTSGLFRPRIPHSTCPQGKVVGKSLRIEWL